MVIGGRDFIIPLKAIYTWYIYIYIANWVIICYRSHHLRSNQENIEADSCWFSTQRSKLKSNKMSSEPRKEPSYFPLNPGWLIGILIVVYYSPYITGEYNHLYNPTNQGFVHCSSRKVEILRSLKLTGTVCPSKWMVGILSRFLLGTAIFRGELLVSGRVMMNKKGPRPSKDSGKVP